VFICLGARAEVADGAARISTSTRLGLLPPPRKDPSRRPASTPEGRYAAVGKRVLDLAIVVIGAPAWLVVFAVIATLLVLIQGRPVLYRSTRIGLGGHEIGVLKFRTMRRDAQERLEALLAADSALAEEFYESDELRYKLRDDPRVTTIGRLLRRSSLDELPQLLNVLRGSMSLVGPRPVLLEEFKEFYADVADDVLRVRPGLTGPWQVSGRSLLGYDGRVALDVEYGRRCSLKTDLLILLKTVPAVFRGHGAF
jgi:exopolysaccharide production protein ExoY